MIKNGNSNNSTFKPVSLICYLCGKEYGTSSLEIHLKSCKSQFIIKNPKIDMSSHKPELLDIILSHAKTKKQIDSNMMSDYNKEAENLYKEVNYFGCPNCGRKFVDDRLEVHLRGCKSVNNNTNNNIKNSNDTKHKKNKSSIISTSTSTQILEEKLEKQLKENSSSSQSKPLFLVCYICGREFGKHSIEFHLKSCNEKIDSNNKNNKNDYKIPTELSEILSKLSFKEEPNLSEIQKYNQIAEKIFKEKTMKECKNCKRRFLPDRLEVHLRSCNKNETKYESAGPKMTSRPQMHMCPLCGREFGSMSLPIHMKKCMEVFERQQLDLPVNERRSCEKIIEKYNQAKVSLKSSGEYNLESMNNDAYDIWSKEALIPCENCGRTFLPDRLKVHLRSCKIKK